MQIDFFEEFPSAESLAPLALWKKPCTVYLAAHDLAEFDSSADLLCKIAPLAAPAFWPLLHSTYWVSPFSNLGDLQKLRSTLSSRRGLRVLLDLELPVLSGRRAQFLKGIGTFSKGRKIIREILSLDHRFLLAVYPSVGWLTQKLLIALGVDAPGYESCVMHYTSMMPGWVTRLSERMLRIRAKRGQRTLGLGCLAPGIFGTEPVISPESLRRDLEFCKAAGINRVVLFRAAGLAGYHSVLDSI